jgi:hypothetical protein
MINSTTFDTTYALSALFMWIVFSYLANMLNCDLQRMLKTNLFVVHVTGVAAFFFLFTLLDPSNKSSIAIIWLKTILVYSLFVMMTKSKWYFVVPVLVLLLLDQSLKKEVAIRQAREMPNDTLKGWQEQISQVLNKVIIVIIVIGMLHYMYLQKIQHHKQFTLTKFFFGVANNCKTVAPDYTKLAKRF